MALDGYLSVLQELEEQIESASNKIKALVREDSEARLLIFMGILPSKGQSGSDG